MNTRTTVRTASWRQGISLAFLTVAMAFLAVPSCQAAEPQAAPKKQAPEIKLDVSQLEALQSFAKRAQKVADDWYPQIVQILGAEKGTVPPRITIVIDLDNDGVAGTSGDRISVSAKYALKHPDDFGMIVHEMTHVVQGYPNYDPVWLVEGVADYVRWFNYEPESRRPHPNAARAHYNDSYQTSAAFLFWAANKYDKNLVKKLDAALKSNTYSEEIFRKSTGKGLDALGAEWLETLKK